VSTLRQIINLNRLTTVLFPLMVIFMEVLWISPWLALIGRWSALVEHRQPLSLASLVFLLGASFLVTRFSLSKQWSLQRTQRSIIACGIVATLIVMRIEYPAGATILDLTWPVRIARLLIGSFTHLHPVIFASAVAVYLWWRGIKLGRSPLHSEDIYRSFSIGLLALIVLIVLLGANPLNSLTSIGLYIAGFFFCSLSALALAKLQRMLEQGEEKEGKAVLDSRWLSIIAAVTGTIVVVGAGFASVFSTDFPSFLRQLFNLTSTLLFKVIY
jgi:hypothetical protein